MLFALVQSSYQTGLAVNNPELPLVALHCGGWERWIWWSVRACTLFAPSEGPRFRPLHAFSFVLICFLRKCNYRTRRGFAVNNPELPLAALHCGGWERWIWWSVRACTLFASTEGSCFRPLLTFSFVLLCFLRKCNHRTIRV